MGRRIIGLGASLFVAALVLHAAPAGAAAQATGSIAGEVVSAETGSPLAGAQVYIPGTRLGGLTGANGRFLLLEVPVGNHTIRVQLIGYANVDRNVTVTAGQTVVANFELSESAIALDEIVVTGSGVATEKRKLGNTVATISADKLADAPITSFSEVLQGREPGVVGLPSGGLTGEGARIRIRGSNSLAMSNEPIVYVNGVRIDNGGGFAGIGTGGGGTPSRLDDIDPSSIERVEILKGAAAATLYGSEASGGVIQIFTKTGARAGGQTRWDVQVEQGFLEYPDVFKPIAGFGRDADQVAQINEFWGLNVQPYEVFEVQPLDRVLETGHRQVYSVGLSGGTEVLSYYGSVRHAYEDGPVGYEEQGNARDDNRKTQGTVNLTVYPRDDLEIRLTSLYTDGVHNTLTNNNNIYAPFTLAMFAKPEFAECYGTDAAGDPSEPRGDGTCTGQGNEFGVRAFGTVRETMQRTFQQEAQHYTGSVGATYRAAEGLSLSTILGIDLVNEHTSFFAPFNWNVDGFTTNNVEGARTLSDRNKRQLSLDVRGVWDTGFGEDWTSQFVIGTQGFITKTQVQLADVRDFPGPGFEVLSAGATIGSTTEAFESVVNAGILAQEQIGWKDWVFATFGARYDWNSAFGENEPGAFYPKFSVSVVPSSRPTWNRELLSTLRVRGAIGQSGLQPGAFDRLTTYGPLRTEFGAGVEPDNLGNPDLKPEVATEWEVGAELGVLNNSAAFEITYWDRTVNDALVSRQFPVTGGFLERQLVNIGELAAHGLELSLTGSPYTRGPVSVDLFANAAYLKEKIVDLGGAPALKVGESYTRYRNWLREGHAPGAFFGPELDESVQYPIDIDGDCAAETEAELLAYFADPRAATTTAIRPLVLDCEGDFLGRYLGKPNPDWQGSFGGSVQFGAFRLSTLLEYKMGNFHVHNLTDAFRRSHPALGGNIRGKSEVEAILANPASTPEQRLAAANEFVREWAALAPFDGLHEIEEADFIRWREVQLTYQVPPAAFQRFGLSSLSLSLAGRNLGFLMNKYGGTDPEVNLLGRNSAGGLDDYAHSIDAFGFPLPRQYIVSARASF